MNLSPALQFSKDNIMLRGVIALAAVSFVLPGLLGIDPPSWIGERHVGEIAESIEDDYVAQVESVDDLLVREESEQLETAETSRQDEVEESAVEARVEILAEAKAKADEEVRVREAEEARATSEAELAKARLEAELLQEVEAARALIPVPKPEKPEVQLEQASTGNAAASASPSEQARTPPSWLGGRTTARNNVEVPRDFIASIPPSHVELAASDRKQHFVGITLPLILAANEEILQRRQEVMKAIEAQDRGSLEKWAELYRVRTDDRSLEEIEQDILLRVDTVPVSLALAQAAIESAWGTSRFALQGNALYGQWAWQKDQGIEPADASDSRAVIRSFPDLYGSVRAYMHNLNTHPSYSDFRERRNLIRDRGRQDAGFQLANFLENYAAIGKDYVDRLRQLIRANEFGKYENALLR